MLYIYPQTPAVVRRLFVKMVPIEVTQRLASDTWHSAVNLSKSYYGPVKQFCGSLMNFKKL